jgi:hypothetical protein
VGGVADVTRGVRHWEQKRALCRTGALQVGQVGRVSPTETDVIDLPHCLQKRASGRRVTPQWGHTGIPPDDRGPRRCDSATAYCGNAFRHCLQKRASGRLGAPHCGQTFTALRSRVITACKQPDQIAQWNRYAAPQFQGRLSRCDGAPGDWISSPL